MAPPAVAISPPASAGATETDGWSDLEPSHGATPDVERQAALAFAEAEARTRAEEAEAAAMEAEEQAEREEELALFQEQIGRPIANAILPTAHGGSSTSSSSAPVATTSTAQRESPTKLLAQLMLQGWTLTAETCPKPECAAIPLARNRLRHRHCVGCGSTYVDPTVVGVAAVAEPSAGSLPGPAGGVGQRPEQTVAAPAIVVERATISAVSTSHKREPSREPEPSGHIKRSRSKQPQDVSASNAGAPYLPPQPNPRPTVPAPVIPTAPPQALALVPLSDLSSLLSSHLALLHTRLHAVHEQLRSLYLAPDGSSRVTNLTKEERERANGLVRESGELARAVKEVVGAREEL
ncbi:hypothetical protein HDU93_005551 [Gonapodya sp. JEL0774]|nr:hypothetical protein HDU93_005551 [Gonapodya sp. JEL0774]